MTIKAAAMRPGRQSLEWLQSTIAELKAGDPLAPITVVVPSNHIGLAIRRWLARTGYANVRFGVMGRLVEPLGAPALAAAGKAPLTTATEAAAIREAVRRVGHDFGEAGSHPALVKTLRDLFQELRASELGDEQLGDLGAWGRMAAAAVATFRAYRDVIAGANLYDDHDLLGSATDALHAEGSARIVGELGAAIVYLPAGIKLSEARFLKALATRCPVRVALTQFGDELADATSDRIARVLDVDLARLPHNSPAPNPQLVATPDASEEIRSAVRFLLSRIEAGQELGPVAMVYSEAEPYGPQLRDTLDAARVPWAGIDGRPLSESWAGRGLLGLLGLREHEFGRVQVLAWLGSLPETDPAHVSIGDWDRLSRRAAVVRGAHQWQERLRKQASDARAEADGMEKDGRSEGLIRYRRREADAMDRMASFIERAESDTRTPTDQTWSGLAAWAEKVRRQFVPTADDWPARELEADEMVGEQLAQLGAAGIVEGQPGFERFVEACQSALEGRRQAEGKLGSGVAIGPISALVGLDFDLVFILGTTERALPRPDAPDPVFPPDGGPDPLGRSERRRAEQRRNFLAAVAAGREARLSFPAWDPDLRPSYPSPWVIELAEASGAPVSAARLREGRGASNVETIQSPDAGLASAPALLHVGEWRTRVARGERGNLRSSGLATRHDLPLGRHLETRRARLSDDFTEFDGNVETELTAFEVLAKGLNSAPLSPSSIEGWASCPFTYLLERVLHVEPTERPEQETSWSIGAAAKGALIHGILSRFFGDRSLAPLETYTNADRDRVEEIALAEFAKMEGAGATGHRLAWDNEKHAILADLRTFLRRDEELRQDGLVPRFFEQGFGMKGDEWEQLVVDLGEGRAARLRGRIDRVDLGPDPDAPQQARLIDYKTGSAYGEKDFRDDPAVAGTKVQPSVYMAAIKAKYPGISVESGYWFISSKGGFEFLPVPVRDGRLAEVLDVMDRGLRAGAFPAVPGDETMRPGKAETWGNCVYCAFDRICPTGRDRLWERKRDRPGSRIHGELSAPDGA